jgi:hypothetical protein
MLFDEFYAEAHGKQESTSMLRLGASFRRSYLLWLLRWVNSSQR